MSGIHSTGRGGAGNIGVDGAVYTDAGIVREGPVGESANGTSEFSTGRGGAGNVGSPRLKPQKDGAAVPAAVQPTRRTDEEVVPETAVRENMRTGDYANFHTGIGGGGNVHKEKYGGHSTKAEQEAAERSNKNSIGDKVRKALRLDK